jgi:hypothetical protein
LVRAQLLERSVRESDPAARCHDPGLLPEEDRDVDGYYAFFVFDPDGLRIEILVWPRAQN